mmetsp:Transcript_78708/g.248788  ORF Transcript_78708/g.248788 Transcript_78708/m.248788 type:complete len:570 (-) Transcript_78708:544-2253(-)
MHAFFSSGVAPADVWRSEGPASPRTSRASSPPQRSVRGRQRAAAGGQGPQAHRGLLPRRHLRRHRRRRPPGPRGLRRSPGAPAGGAAVVASHHGGLLGHVPSGRVRAAHRDRGVPAHRGAEHAGPRAVRGRRRAGGWPRLAPALPGRAPLRLSSHRRGHGPPLPHGPGDLGQVHDAHPGDRGVHTELQVAPGVRLQARRAEFPLRHPRRGGAERGGPLRPRAHAQGPERRACGRGVAGRPFAQLGLRGSGHSHVGAAGKVHQAPREGHRDLQHGPQPLEASWALQRGHHAADVPAALCWGESPDAGCDAASPRLRRLRPDAHVHPPEVGRPPREEHGSDGHARLPAVPAGVGEDHPFEREAKCQAGVQAVGAACGGAAGADEGRDNSSPPGQVPLPLRRAACPKRDPEQVRLPAWAGIGLRRAHHHQQDVDSLVNASCIDARRIYASLHASRISDSRVIQGQQGGLGPGWHHVRRHHVRRQEESQELRRPPGAGGVLGPASRERAPGLGSLHEVPLDENPQGEGRAGVPRRGRHYSRDKGEEVRPRGRDYDGGHRSGVEEDSPRAVVHP